MISRRSMLRFLGVAALPGRVEIPAVAPNRPPGLGENRAPKGVVAEVLLAKRRFALGEPIAFAFQIRNLSGRPIAYRVGYFFYYHLVEVRSLGISAPITEQGEQERRLFGSNGRGRRGRNRFELLAAGESYKNGDEAPGPAALSEGLNDLFHLFPGVFTVRVTYENTFFPNPFRVVTPAVQFEVF